MDIGIIVKLVILSFYGGTCLPTGSGQSSTQHPPLVTTCQVMKQIASDMSAAINTTGALNSCYLSTNCTQVLCGSLSRRRIDFLMEVLLCRDPLSIRIVRFNDMRMTYESFLYKSQMIGLDLGYGFTTLNFMLAPRITRLSIGIKVDKVDPNQGTTTQFISQQEIPVDIYSCPGSVRPKSETCQVTENMAQYLNYFFTSVLKMNFESTPDCIPSTSCNDVECVLPGGGYYKYSLMVCQMPPALRLLNVLSNGTTFFQHITNHSDIFTLPQAPQITLNITFKKIDPSTVGLGLSFTDSTKGNQYYTEIPYIEVPVNTSACAANYTRTSLVSSCDIMPLLASPQCSVNQPDCDTATCQVTQLSGSIEIELYSCFVPPAVALRLRDSQGNIVAAVRKTSESKPVDNSMLFFTVVQHSDESSVGVEVTSRATNESYIRYLEIPVNRSSCPPNIVQHPSTITCETMSYIAQYLTVFFANVTRQREATPECMASEPNCNNITCTFIDNSYYSIDILPCASPTVLHLELHGPNGTTIVKHTFSPGTQTERLDENTQVKVTLSTAPDLVILEMIVMYDDGSYSFTLPAIPNVLIPLDTSGCKQIPPTPPSHMTHASTAGIPQTTLLAIEIAAPVGGLLLAIICIMCCVILGMCVRQSRVKHARDNYNFQRLSIAAQDYDDEVEDDEEEDETEK